jgi:hypothetical protein
MIKIPRSQSTSIKHMIYPDQPKINPKYHKNNIESIKKKQQENRERKDHEEHYIPRKHLII